MARDAEMDARLQRWAHGVTVGDGAGFPAMSVLHPSWQPPAPGTIPVLKAAAPSDVRQTHRALGVLSDRLRATVVAHYVLRPPIAEQAAMLECAQATVHARVERVHTQLRAVLHDARDSSF